jgi:hypothetical protein
MKWMSGGVTRKCDRALVELRPVRRGLPLRVEVEVIVVQVEPGRRRARAAVPTMRLDLSGPLDLANDFQSSSLKH